MVYSPDDPFWRKPLTEMSQGEWESLCDGCGRCCLVKLEDEDTGKVHFTSVGCRLLRADDCRCGDYPNRRDKVPDCIKLTPEIVATVAWLPPTCAYRLVHEGKDLPDWHPLISGDRDSVHKAGISAKGRLAAGEDDVPEDQLPDFIVTWPTKWPAKARPKVVTKAKGKPKRKDLGG